MRGERRASDDCGEEPGEPLVNDASGSAELVERVGEGRDLGLASEEPGAIRVSAGKEAVDLTDDLRFEPPTFPRLGQDEAHGPLKEHGRHLYAEGDTLNAAVPEDAFEIRHREVTDAELWDCGQEKRVKLPFPLPLPLGRGGAPEVSDNGLPLPNDVHRNRLVGRGVPAVARDAAVAWTDGVRRDQPVLAVEPRRTDASLGAENADAAVGDSRIPSV